MHHESDRKRHVHGPLGWIQDFVWGRRKRRLATIIHQLNLSEGRRPHSVEERLHHSSVGMTRWYIDRVGRD